MHQGRSLSVTLSASLNGCRRGLPERRQRWTGCPSGRWLDKGPEHAATHAAALEAVLDVVGRRGDRGGHVCLPEERLESRYDHRVAATEPASARGHRATIQEVAARAGVSIATVSRVMSGSTKVREELAARVRAAADEFGYRPSFAARSLATGATQMVGMVVPNLANPYFYEVIKSINLAAVEAGYQIAVGDANEDAEQELELCRSFMDKLDGLLLMSPRMSTRAMRTLTRETPNLVLLNRVVPEVGAPTVAIDSHGSMLELCGHLLSLGHRRVVYLAGPADSWSNVERWRAVRNARAFGLEAEEVPAGGTIEAGYRTVEQALEQNATAIICHNDLVAFGALSRLQELGVRVPADVSLTGFDDIPFASYASPALTTVRSHGDLGAEGWRVMRQVMRTEPPDEMTLLPAGLVVRASTAPPPSRAVTS
jgi:LacI family repressor for deo operon, udp, cdd, tsx, nupC, and nupG